MGMGDLDWLSMALLVLHLKLLCKEFNSIYLNGRGAHKVCQRMSEVHSIDSKQQLETEGGSEVARV
jgi:hypothetical protein